MTYQKNDNIIITARNLTENIIFAEIYVRNEQKEFSRTDGEQIIGVS